MGATVPVMVTNLVFYIFISRTLLNRDAQSTSTRDRTLSRAFLLQSVSWMILWSPKVVFHIVYGFRAVPDIDVIYDVVEIEFDVVRRHLTTDFILVFISVLFSSVNSAILIVVLRPFHDPLLKMGKCIQHMLQNVFKKAFLKSRE